MAEFVNMFGKFPAAFAKLGDFYSKKICSHCGAHRDALEGRDVMLRNVVLMDFALLGITARGFKSKGH